MPPLKGPGGTPGPQEPGHRGGSHSQQPSLAWLSSASSKKASVVTVPPSMINLISIHGWGW